ASSARAPHTERHAAGRPAAAARTAPRPPRRLSSILELCRRQKPCRSAIRAPQVQDRRGGGQRISQIVAPADRTSPTAAVRPVTTPALCALSGCSIFIASRTTTRSPSATVSPSLTAIFTIVPCIGAVSASPLAVAVARLPPPRRGRVAVAPPVAAPPAPAAAPRPAGSDTSSRLPPTSTTMLVRSSASGSAAAPLNGGTPPAHSVSIHRVCTVKG